MSPFSLFLRTLRFQRGLKQKELAVKLGYEPSYVSALERSEKGPPREDFILRLIRDLALNLDEGVTLDKALAASRRQLSLPATASIEEYQLIEMLRPQLGRLSPVQIQLIELALKMPELAGSATTSA
jgi:transcriptional regulator with XRE-family HTH domain